MNVENYSQYKRACIGIRAKNTLSGHPFILQSMIKNQLCESGAVFLNSAKADISEMHGFHWTVTLSMQWTENWLLWNNILKF